MSRKTAHFIEDNNRLLFSIAGSLYELDEKVNRLDYLIQRKEIEQILHPKGRKEKQNEN
jgi:hypothetical protein